MTAYPAQFYKDPADLVDAIRRQQCDGCESESVLFFQDKKARGCDRGNKHSDNGGSRCNHFKRKGVVNAK